MKRLVGSLLLAVFIAPVPGASQTVAAGFARDGVVMTTPGDLRWQVMPQFADGRERAVLLGNPETGGDWVYRIRVSRPIRVEAHTHPVDEVITVLEGEWSFGLGKTFDASKLVSFPAGSFVRIPANTPHFVATGESTVIIQSSGSGVFATVLAQ